MSGREKEGKKERKTHEKLHPVQAPLSLITFDQIYQPPRRSDEDVRSLAKLNCLCHHVHSSNNDRRVKVDGRSDDAELLRDLEGEFSVNGRALEGAKRRRREAKRKTNRVGVRTMAKKPYGSLARACMMGRAKAMVFPLPV